MLVTQLKAGQRIKIGADIEVLITRVIGNRVSITIFAPREVRIRRGELAFKDRSEEVRTCSAITVDI
ncbi:carbon storage regulator [Pirellulaceae bacterium SH467]